MANGFNYGGGNVAGANFEGSNFVNHLANRIGQTVTIFTTSGGQSGSGFTGVLATVTPSFVRLITQIGPAPGCALGNCCDKIGHGGSCCDNMSEQGGDFNNNLGNQSGDFNNNLGNQGRATCHVNNLGSIVDIPIGTIASFVHNAVGSGGY
ncbi:hypothetical protein NBE98_10810 [Clostridium swellfunianum]|uniref:hypothetical protein n=1 Tax=Clostridium swellfunianum TaxID=1367462 RepID=UPI002030AAD3|nr:hypothetical protein [Clostridium swellfunianum]MCM0648866.1 hypothetical protein [Clostridium swellfunianum]